MKPKAPTWLREAFRDGVDDREEIETMTGPRFYGCWLAQFDPAHKPCEGKLERFHFLSRQRVESALGLALQCLEEDGPVEHSWYVHPAPDPDIILIAAWDPRNGGIACEAHHRRFDSHLVPLPSEQLVVPYDALPEHVIEFAEERGLELQLEEQCPLHKAGV